LLWNTAVTCNTTNRSRDQFEITVILRRILFYVFLRKMELEQTIEFYRSLQLDQVIDHQKFSEYALTHHSTSIEGSTLTEEDTRMLLDEGVTPKGKPLEHSLMVKDHYEALQFTLKQAKAGKPISIQTIQTIAAMVLKSTGKIYHTVLGNDATKGEFRKGNVRAGASYFVSYDKVEMLTGKLVNHLQKEMTHSKSITDAIELANVAHFDLVSIHPFYDGNGRTSRLLMNYIQAFYDLPLANVFKEDRTEYFQALTEARKEENVQIFQDFMKSQYSKLLQQEIKAYQQMQKGQTLLPKNRVSKGRGHSLFF
jgi:Fic family protein